MLKLINGASVPLKNLIKMIGFVPLILQLVNLVTMEMMNQEMTLMKMRIEE